MDPFIRLPWFALKSVLSNLPDLFSLHSLCSASPSVAAFLRENNDLFVQIIDAIMARPSRDRGLLPYIRELVRLVILLRSRQSIGTGAVYSYAEIIESLRNLGEQPPRGQSSKLEAVPLTIPSAVLFKLLDLVTQLRCVAHKCFHSMIHRCLKLPIEHLPQRDFTAQGKGMRVGKYRNEGPPTDPSQRPQGIPYVPVNIGPMTRLEEQRLIGSLLHIVVFYELRAVYTESPTIPEISQHADVLLVGNVAGFWERFESSYTSLPEQLKTVLLWMDEQAGGRENVLSWLHSFACCEGSKCCQQYTLVAGDQEQWDETKCSIMYGKSRGYDCLWRSKVSVHSPIRHIELSTFRPYGLVFWEKSRLEALGYPTEGNPMPLWFALSSMFSEQDWEGVISQQHARS
ncbi:hypothetical protein BJY01DRAFT_259276 [Aspergillus pseudoustus]|uniref:F-box domain-containing protein n=1 Tax=Aspergillus pseudoustus TaxID=1810923 RepID=A0ABR4J8G5_9EURO